MQNNRVEYIEIYAQCSYSFGNNSKLVKLDVKRWFVYPVFSHRVEDIALTLSAPHRFPDNIHLVKQAISWKTVSHSVVSHSWVYGTFCINSHRVSTISNLVKQGASWKMVSPLCCFTKLSKWNCLHRPHEGFQTILSLWNKMFLEWWCPRGAVWQSWLYGTFCIVPAEVFKHL